MKNSLSTKKEKQRAYTGISTPSKSRIQRERLCGLRFIHTMLASSTGPGEGSRAKGHSDNRHICFCWQRTQSDTGVLAGTHKGGFEDFPQTGNRRNHKTHLLTLSGHSWDGPFPQRRGRRQSREEEEEECGGRAWGLSQTSVGGGRSPGGDSPSRRSSPSTCPRRSGPRPPGRYRSSRAQTGR